MFDQLRTDLVFAIRSQRKTPMMTAAALRYE